MRSLIAIALLIPAIIADGELKACYASYQPVYDLAAEKCLATMVYGEARGEAERGMVAVAYTAVNRAAKKTVCNVVLSPKQYSVFNDNPALRAAAMSLHLEPKQKNVIDKAGWDQAVKVAQDVMRKQVPDPTEGATHYLADKVMRAKGYVYPRWSKEYKMVVVIDNHKFYKPIDKKVASL
jgi:spore germination cell wall hydrolase CwlJ-like protein